MRYVLKENLFDLRRMPRASPSNPADADEVAANVEDEAICPGDLARFARALAGGVARVATHDARGRRRRRPLLDPAFVSGA